MTDAPRPTAASSPPWTRPMFAHWKSLTRRQASWLLVLGLALELPVRWIVRPTMAHLRPESPWFDLPLRIGIEAAMILAPLGIVLLARIPLAAVGVPQRRWTRWEWAALAVIAAGELAVVLGVAGHRWPRVWGAGLAGEGLAWAFGEFLFGFNQETGFRGLIMTGLLRLRGWRTATVLNTLLFLVGPLHGLGSLESWQQNPVTMGGYAVGVIVCGLSYSWLRYRTDNVVLCAILHGIINGPMNGAALVLRAHPMG